MGEPAKKLEHPTEPALKVVERPAADPADPKTEKRLREFGILMAAVLIAISAFLLWRGRPAAMITLPAALVFLAPAYFHPRALGLIEHGWLAFGERMSRVMTFVLLTLTYFLIMTPMGLFLRLIRKDLLDLKLDKSAKTYWKPVEPDGPHTRPYLPY